MTDAEKTRRQGPWIDVYPFNGRGLTIENTGGRVSLNTELRRYVDRLWAPKAARGWRSSIVPFAHGISFGNDDITVQAGAMRFHQIDGMDKAIEEGLPFAPEQRFVPCLSVGFVTGTEDGKVILQRRGPDVHVPNTLIEEPCGYMTSRDIPRVKRYENRRHFHNPRLFDQIVMLDARKREIARAVGVNPESVTYDPKQDFLGAGWLTTEAYFGTTGKVDARSTDLAPRDGVETVYVDFNDLKPLILAQGRLSRVSPVGYRPNNVREMPVIDETTLGLIYGYRKLTGDNTFNEMEVIDRLNHDGLNIKVFDTTPGQSYAFPTRF